MKNAAEKLPQPQESRTSTYKVEYQMKYGQSRANLGKNGRPYMNRAS